MKKTYTSVQYAQGSLIFLALALLWIFLPWYGITTPFGSQTFNGFEGDFLGGWMVVALVLGAGAAAGYAFRIVGPAGGRAALGVGILGYALAVILGLADGFRDLETIDTDFAKARRWYPGPYGVAFSALFGALCVGGALAQLQKEEDARADGGGATHPTPPPAPPV